jgi:hypothetical protein
MVQWHLDIPPTFAGASKNASTSFVQSIDLFLDVSSSSLTFSRTSTSETGGERMHGRLLGASVPVKTQKLMT